MLKLHFKINSCDKYKSGVYCISSLIDQRVYVGSTVNFYRRWKEYNCKLQNGHSHNQHLLNFVKKHGINNLEFSILEICSELLLETNERDWMEKLDSIESGFNIRKDAVSNRGLKHTEETKQRMSLNNPRKNLGKRLSDEEKRKITAGLKSFWNSKGESYRKEHGRKSVETRIITDETLQKLSKSSKAYLLNHKHPACKTVLQINLLTNQEINEFQSITQAALETSTDATGISKTIKGEQKSAGGFYWRFK